MTFQLSSTFAVAFVLALVRASAWVVICPPFSNAANANGTKSPSKNNPCSVPRHDRRGTARRARLFPLRDCQPPDGQGCFGFPTFWSVSTENNIKLLKV